MPSSPVLRIATRASNLAMWQARHVASLLAAAVPDITVKIVEVSTLGDRDLAGSLRNLGPFGVFTREVQKVVLDGAADIAVHSLKDLPTDPVAGLALAAVPERGALLDALVMPLEKGVAEPWLSLPQQARVGTESLRRRAQLLHQRPDLQFLQVRGNVETRLRKLDEGEYDALVLAAAGLERLGLEGRISQRLLPPLMFPAVGQGALGIECRADDEIALSCLQRIEHAATRAAVTAERSLLSDLRAGCHAPVGVWTEEQAGGTLRLEGVVLSPDGATRLTAEAAGPLSAAAELGRAVAELLRSQGAADLIASSV